MTQGYIKLYRQLQHNEEWLSEPFTRSQAWIDMLLNAAHRPHAIRIRGIKITLERGQLAMSEVEYATRWKWSRGKVRRFLAEKASKTVQQIVQQKNNVSTIVTIINYDAYQGDGQQTVQQVVQQTDSKRTANGHIQECKEGIEGKECKENGAQAIAKQSQAIATSRFRKPSAEQVDEYAKSIKARIDPNHFIDYYESNGWRVGKNPMKDWKAAVRTWKRNQTQEHQPQEQNRWHSL